MSPNTIRILDKWLGRPLCCLLTAWKYFWDISSLGRKIDNPVKIVFIKLIEQGATVLAFSTIREAVRIVGKGNTFFCVFKNNKPILDILDLIPQENIFVIRQNNIFIFIWDVLKFVLLCRKHRIDSTVDMEFFSRSSVILSYLSGARNRVGLHRFTSELPYRGNLMTHRIQYNPYLHTAKAFRLLVDALLRDPAEIPMMKIQHENIPVEIPRFIPDDILLRKMAGQLPFAIGGEVCRPVILLNPNASDMLPVRKWPEENFIGLGVRLMNQFKNITLIITGAPSEKEAAEKICSRIKQETGSVRAGYVLNYAGKTTLYELLVLYSLADALVTNDSGPGHFASMTSVKSIILFGPETPELFGPLGNNSKVIWKQLACSPCVNPFNHRFSPCKDNVCMKTISVDEVLDKVIRALYGTSVSGAPR
ncbi:MAG: glycosyltransferase family 9 protein [Bacteroidetes bacterium]|nr:glycosyltransferase family 9 protein [Bacteroidota bacterium]